MRYPLVVLLLVVPLLGAGCDSRPGRVPAPAPAERDAFANPAAALSATLFGRGMISTEAPEFSLTATPDGDAVYFNRSSRDFKQHTIMQARRRAGSWGAATVVPFSGVHRDIDPFVTRDGHRLYFSSDRPAPMHASSAAGFELWYVDRDATGRFDEPRHVDGPPNGVGSIGFVSLANDGTLYFDAFVDGVRGVYRCRPRGPSFLPAEPLRIDGLVTERRGNPLISPDGTFLVFYLERDSGFGESDLYLARAMPDGGFSAPQNLGPLVNSPQGEFAPGFSPDGRYLFFASERPGVVAAPEHAEGRPPADIYQVALASLWRALPAPPP